MDDLGNRKNGAILACSSRIMDGARAACIEVRLLGGVGVYLKCKAFRTLISKTRSPLSDIDLVTTSEHVQRLEKFFETLGFKQDQEFRVLFGHQRRVFYTQEDISIDVYIDKLILCQDVPLRDRISLDYPTLSLTDLLLSKIQNIAPKAKDIIDMQVLVQHVAESASKYDFDLTYISQLCTQWGWWRTWQPSRRVAGRRRRP